MIKEPRINPVSDYPECDNCPVKATKDCPALYRVAEHCTHYDIIIKNKIGRDY